jgi:hypothetical protein
MLFLFHAGNLGNLVFEKLLKKAANGAYQVWIYYRTTLKSKIVSNFILKIGTVLLKLFNMDF